MTPTAPPKQAPAPGVPRMEGTTGLSMWLGVLRGPLVIAVLFAIVLAFGSSFDIYVAGSIAIYGLASAGAPEGLDVLARLTEQSDVVLTNALPEASARLGIDYATVAARNPAACHISILGFGHRPPFGGRRVVDAAAQALSGQALAGAAGLFSRAGLADWTSVRTLEQTARADTEDFVRVAQEPWGFLVEPRLLPRYDGDQRPPVTGAAAAPGRDDAEVLRRYGLDGRRDALVASGAMRSEPGQSTLQASSV